MNEANAYDVKQVAQACVKLGLEASVARHASVGAVSEFETNNTYNTSMNNNNNNNNSTLSFNLFDDAQAAALKLALCNEQPEQPQCDDTVVVSRERYVQSEAPARRMSTPRAVLSDEERRARRNEASKRCREKMRQRMIEAGLVSAEPRAKLSDEERRQHRIEASKRCREKQRLADAALGIVHEPRVKLSDDERRQRRNEASLRCYYKRKAERETALAALNAQQPAAE